MVSGAGVGFGVFWALVVGGTAVVVLGHEVVRRAASFFAGRFRGAPLRAP